jgi:hypothetical protein
MNWDSNQALAGNSPGMVGRILSLFVVWSTVVCLALAARNALSVLVGSDDQEEGTFLVEVSGKNGGFGTVRPELLLKAIVLDGRVLSSEAAITKSNWELVDKEGSPPYLLYSGGFDPALVAFHGKRFLAVFQSINWGGVFRIKRNGTDVSTLALRHPGGREGLIILESPPAAPSLAVFVTALIVFAGCAYWFGPIRAGRSSIPWLLFFLLALHFLYWGSQGVGTEPDSPGYLEAVSDFYVKGIPSYFPPGYPALLAVVGIFSDKSLGRWVTLIQHGMAVLVALWIYLILRRILAEELALIGGILSGALPLNLTAAQTILSETPTIFAMVGALYFTVRSVESGRFGFAVLSGLLTGWAGTLRVVPLVCLLPAICTLHLLPLTKRALRLTITTGAVAVILVALPMLWLGYNSGQLVLANSFGLHLFNRVVYEQKQLDEDGPATRTLITLQRGRDPRAGYWWDLEDPGGFDERQAEILLRRVSWEGIRKDPWAFLIYTPTLAWKILWADASDSMPQWGETAKVYPHLDSTPPLVFTASSLAWRFTLDQTNRVLWPVLCWSAVFGLFLGLFLPRRTLVLAFAWVPISYLLSTACLESFDPRYNIPTIPFITALSLIPLAFVLRLFEFNERMTRKLTLEDHAEHGAGGYAGTDLRR